MKTEKITIYHNPRCSKSRQTLSLIEAEQIEPTIVRYLDTPLDVTTLKELLAKLGISARQLLRSSEDEFKTLNLGDATLSEDQLIAAMVAHPRLIERPIVVKGPRAVLGRPPENVLALLGK